MPVADYILKNFSISVDGKGYAGNAEEFKPPKLGVKTDDHRAGGMDGPIAIDMGMEGLETSFVLTGHFPEVLSLWGVAVGEKTQLTARGALESWDGSVKPVVINMRGTVTSIEDGSWKAGEKNNQTFTMKLEYYKREQDGTILHEIDIPNMKRAINGKDRLEEIRNAIKV